MAQLITCHGLSQVTPTIQDSSGPTLTTPFTVSLQRPLFSDRTTVKNSVMCFCPGARDGEGVGWGEKEEGGREGPGGGRRQFHADIANH